MTKEELMQPRYEVVADYPGRPNSMPVGHILKLDKFGAGKYWHEYTDEEPIHIDEGSTRFPKVLLLLHWWEHRKLEDFPLYLIRATPPYQVYKIGKLLLKDGCFLIDGYDFPESLSLYEPATETEYTNYITQTK